MWKHPRAPLQISAPSPCCSVSSGRLGVAPAPDLLPSHEPPCYCKAQSRLMGLHPLLCKTRQVQTCTSQPRAGICLTAAVQDKMFPRRDAALMRNDRQPENKLQLCTSQLETYKKELKSYVRWESEPLFTWGSFFQGYLISLDLKSPQSLDPKTSNLIFCIFLLRHHEVKNVWYCFLKAFSRNKNSSKPAHPGNYSFNSCS